MSVTQAIRIFGMIAIALGIAVAGAIGLRAFGAGLGKQASSERPLATAIRTKKVDGQTHLLLTKDTLAAGGIEIVRLKSIKFQQRFAALGTIVQPQTLLDQRRAYQTAAADVARADIAAGATEVELQRQQHLHRDRVATTKVLEAAQTAAGTSKINLQLARTQLRLQSTTLKQQWGPVLADWLISGSPQLDRLLFGQDLLLQVALPTGQHVINPSIVQLEPPSGDRLDAKIVSAVPQVDPKFQAQSFFAILAADPRLLPGMTVSATVPIGLPMTGVEVPDDAVVRWQGQLYAFAEVAPAEFVGRSISTDIATPNGWLVRSGIDAGTGIVVRGAQLLLSEEMKVRSGGAENP